MKKLLLFFITLLFLSGMFFSEAVASIFKYTDGEGKDHYTDSLDTVPLEYRSSAVNMDEHLQKNPGFVVEPPRPKEPLPERLKYRTTSFVSYWRASVIKVWEATWVRTVGLLVFFMIFFIYAGKIAKALGHKNLSSVIRIFLTTLVMVYLLHSYVTQIAKDFVEMKKNVLEVKERADQRNLEMDRLIKSIVGEKEMKNATEK